MKNTTPRPKILFITNFITPYRVSFYEKLCAETAYEWLIVHGVKSKEDGRPAYAGKLNFPNQPVLYREYQTAGFDLRWQTSIYHIVQTFDPHLIITLGIPGTFSNWVALYWARWHQRRTILWHSGWEAQQGRPLALAFKRLLHRRYLSLSDHILVYSTNGAHALTAEQVPHKKITVCYNGIEIDPLLAQESIIRTRAHELRLQQQPQPRPLFLYVGGLISDKQVDLLLDAFAPLASQADLWIVGDGPEMTQLKTMVMQQTIPNVKFWGRIIEDADVFFAAADYFVLPGLGGLALNQALFWGKPCIVSSADGTEDDLVLENQTGFRFETGNRASLQHALQRAIHTSPQIAQSMGAVGRELVLHRSNVTQMVRTFLQTIQSLLS